VKEGTLLRMPAKLITSLVAALMVVACGSTVEAPKPAELGPNAALIGVRLAWTAKIGEVKFPLAVKANGSQVTLASSDGVVATLDARTGGDVWRTALGVGLSAAAGSDGRYAAAVTQGNELVALDAGREIWRQKLTALSFTAPLVAGSRVFVLGADRSVTAFDAASGRRLWTQNRPGEPLVLRQAGALLAVGDTLVAGLSGRLVGMNPLNGSSRWEIPVAVPRGTNDVERLVDIVSNVSRVGNSVCVRAYQAMVGCVNAERGTLAWNKPAMGAQGLHGDDQFVYGTESDGKVVAWRRQDGERAWVTERLKFRALSAPLVVGRSLAIGDATGFVHLLSRTDGAPLNRLATNGSPIAVAPVLVGDTLVVVTQSGGVFGFRPE
jgi:outer membrane protein assembly factor BamB